MYMYIYRFIIFIIIYLFVDLLLIKISCLLHHILVLFFLLLITLCVSIFNAKSTCIVILGRVSNGPMLAVTSRRIVYLSLKVKIGL